MASHLNWFITRSGRRTMTYATIAASIGTLTLTFMSHTVCIDKYQEFVEMRKFDKPIRVPSKIKALCNTVLDDLKLNNYQKLLVKPFTVFGFDVWHAGSMKSRFGSIIGLPINFTYTDVESVPVDQIEMNNEYVDWKREDAVQLLDNIILSDNAKKYAIAREILMTDNYNAQFQSVISSVMVIAFYAISFKLNRSLRMFTKPRSARVALYLPTAGFTWAVWSMQRDAITKYYEHKIDEKLSELGVDYIEGAIEFYEKTLKRNVALRSLLGSMGEKSFTVTGNPNYFLRIKNLSLTHRKKFFEDKLKSSKPALSDSTFVENSEKLHAM